MADGVRKVSMLSLVWQLAGRDYLLVPKPAGDGGGHHHCSEGQDEVT